MTTPESPRNPEQAAQVYPYHPEAWQEIHDLSKAALGKFEHGEIKGETFIFNTWYYNPHGYMCRLERPSVESTEDTIYYFAFENDVPGYRYFRNQGTAFINRGLRRPLRLNPRDYGILEYSSAQGLIKPPEGRLLERMMQKNERTGKGDPEQMVRSFEGLLKMLLGYATHPPKEPIEPPDYNRHLK